MLRGDVLPALRLDTELLAEDRDERLRLHLADAGQAQQALLELAELVARARIVTNAFLDESTRAPGYQTLDARMGYAVLPRSQAYGGVLNVLDIKQDPGRVGDTRPPLGRIFYVGFRAEFPWEDSE